MARRGDQRNGAGTAALSLQQTVANFVLPHFSAVSECGDKFSYSARCPAHPDQKNSLSLTITVEGKLLAKCHATCEFPDILKAVGIELFRGVPIVAKYQYHDEDGTPLFEVCRTADKQFPPRLPDGKWGCGGLSELYRLPELLDLREEFPDSPVFLCEGEKDTDRCWSVGLSPATCLRGGAAAKWKPEFTERLRGCHLVVFVDNDRAGEAFADRIAKGAYGSVASIKLIKFRELPEHGDVSDFFDGGGTVDELLDRIEKAAAWTPDDGPPSPEPAAQTEGQQDSARYTDLANAREFVRQFKHIVRYCAAWKCFFVWDGTRWVRDDRNYVEHLAKQLADQLWQKAQRDNDDLGRKHATRTASAKGIQSMLVLVRSDPEIAISPDEMDRDHLSLNCPNGTIDLRAGQLREHRPEDFITKLCPTPFDPDAEAPRWEKAIRRIFDGDKELISFVQRLFGYCLTGLVNEQVIVLFIGTGSNGKSLLLLVLLEIVGADYFIKASDDILIRRLSQAHPTAIADLHGKRLAVVMETDAHDRLAEALIKSLTGGDRLRARRMREDFWEFSPSHKIVLCTNHRPHVEATDHAFWRRIRLVPFNVCFWKAGDPGNASKKLPKHLKADPQLGEKLLAEAEGILAWCVRGCLDWQRRGLGTTDAVAAATEEYRVEQDSLHRFIDERCVLKADARIASSVLYAKYHTWCEGVGERPLPANQFKQRLLETHSSVTFKRSDGSWFHGIKGR